VSRKHQDQNGAALRLSLDLRASLQSSQQKCRIIKSDSPDAWYSYGAFLARAGDLGRAEEAFRHAVAITPKEPRPLMALACILWHNGVFTDALYLEHAITVRFAVVAHILDMACC
jgi:Flp pilus assembly protein TadD